MRLSNDSEEQEGTAGERFEEQKDEESHRLGKIFTFSYSDKDLYSEYMKIIHNKLLKL